MKYRKLTVIAQDPSVKRKGKILRSQLSIPWEDIENGPKGSRIHVIDHDFSTNITYSPFINSFDSDPYQNVSDQDLLSDPGFHAINTYAISMSVLSAFEHALGRRIGWSFRGPHLKVAPHAFSEANAYYSKDAEGILFGYIPTSPPTFTCLSHDIIAHEVTHAVVDAMRPNYMRFSSPDQAGFHEGFADVIALLSVLVQEDLISFALGKWVKTDKRMIPSKYLNFDNLKHSVLFSLADEFGSVLSGIRGNPLRHSIKLEVGDDNSRTMEELTEPHKRGEILCAAVMNSFLQVWCNRFQDYIEHNLSVSREHVIEEGASAAKHLRTMMIRALDYIPPIHLSYNEFLIGVLTADTELYPDDKYNYREAIIDWFGQYGITVTEVDIDPNLISETYNWKKQDDIFRYENVHSRELENSLEEAYRFVWDNKDNLDLHPLAYTEITSVRPIKRINSDGFIVRETIIEYLQLLNATARELEQEVDKNGNRLNINLDDQDTILRLHGGGVIVLDEYKKVKFHIYNSLNDKKKQQMYLDYLLRTTHGKKKHLDKGKLLRFSRLHMNRMMSQG